MSQTVKIEMQKRLGVIIRAACNIRNAAYYDKFNPVNFQKDMDNITQHTALVKFDFDYLKNPESKVVAPAKNNRALHSDDCTEPCNLIDQDGCPAECEDYVPPRRSA